MNRWTQIAVAAGVVVVAVVLFVVLRPEDDEEEPEATPAAQTTTAETTTEEATTEETTTEETTTEEAPTTTEEGPQRLVVEVDESGLPVGGVQRFDLEKDARVVLIVRSRVSDHMHLHGYDLLADVAPGSPGRITFRADKTGRFDLELEDRVQLIAELRVR